jgi:hypothetical protein
VEIEPQFDTITCVASRLAILNPCSKRWTDLSGEGRERFCPDCQTHVHALEQCSSEEIEALRRESPDRLCGYLGGESLPQPRSRRVVLVGALLTAISPLMAQSGRVRIRVTDPAGEVIPGAEAFLLGPDGRPQLTKQADDLGEIVLTDLPIGDSRVNVSCQGFASLPLTVTVRNGDEVKVEARLALGVVGEVVTVEVEGILVNPKAEDLPRTPIPNGDPVAVPAAIRSVTLADIPQSPRKRKRWWIFR